MGIENVLGNYSSNTWYEGAAGYRSALSKAKQHEAPLVVYFRTDWCPYCIAVERNLLPKPSAVKALSSFVKVRINPEDGDAEKAIFDKMNGKGFPRFLVVPFGQNYKRISVTPKKGTSNDKYLPVDQFVANLKPYQPAPDLRTAGEYFARSKAYYDQRKLKAATKDAKRAVNLDQTNIEYYKFLDLILLQSKDFDQIIKYWNHYLSLAPKDSDAYMERSGTNYHKGDIKSAIRDAKKAQELGHIEAAEWYQRLINL